MTMPSSEAHDPWRQPLPDRLHRWDRWLRGRRRRTRSSGRRLVLAGVVALALAPPLPAAAASAHDPPARGATIELRVSVGGSLEGGLFTQATTPYCVANVRPPASTLSRAFAQPVLVSVEDVESCLFHEALVDWVFTDLGSSGISTVQVRLRQRRSGAAEVSCDQAHAGLRCRITRDSGTRFQVLIEAGVQG